ncbi:FAD-dependent oxidoreductase [Streptomyces sp. NPDC005859]|uniref:FAD-binding oxidoreductase n=1 Tax=Streptomyces sp. NPDC005859 TaxID=3157170 RepID=UPI0033FFCB91
MYTRRNVLRAGAGAGLALAASAAGAGAVAAGTSAAAGDWTGLGARLQGDLVLPADAGYGLAKQNQFAEFDAVHPTAVAYCETPADVQACIRFARGQGISVRTRSGGHNYRGWSTGEGLVVDVSRIRHATVAASTVRIGPGLQSIDALHALAPHGKQVIAGTCPTVCPGGFLSGGGIGYQTRKFGLGADRVRSVQLVLADGRLVRASAAQHPDLYWGLRGGGGGNFGVVTEFEVEPIDAPRMVFFNTTWSWERAEEVFAAWQTWQLTSSLSLGSALIFMLPDAAPGEVPQIIVTGGYHGSEAEAGAALDQLTSLVGAQPTSRFATDLPYAEAMKTAYGCGDLTQDQCHREGTTSDALLHRVGRLREAYRFFDRPFSPTELNSVVTAWEGERRPGQRRFLHCMSVGGAANAVSPSATAFAHRGANFIVGFTTQLDEPASVEDQQAASAFVATGAALLNPLGSGAYVNFPGSDLPDWASQYYGGNYQRLLDVKRRYDPDDFFRHPRSIGSTAQ